MLWRFFPSINYLQHRKQHCIVPYIHSTMHQTLQYYIYAHYQLNFIIFLKPPCRTHTAHSCGLLLQMLYVAWSVCMLVTWWNVTKTAEPIEMLFGGWLMWVQDTTNYMGQDQTSDNVMLGWVRPEAATRQSLPCLTASCITTGSDINNSELNQQYLMSKLMGNRSRRRWVFTDKAITDIRLHPQCAITPLTVHTSLT